MLERFLKLTTFLFFGILVVLIGLQVFLRYVINNPSVWSEEAARFSMVYLCFFGACLAMKREESLKVTFFIQKLPTKVSLYLGIVLKVFILIFLFFVLWFGINATWQLRGQLSTALQWPKSILYFSLLPPTALMIIITVQQVKKELGKLKPRYKEKDTGETEP